MQLQKSASYIAILLALSLSACSPGKNTTSASAARRTNQPQFIDDIALSGGGNTHVTVKSVGKKKAATTHTSSAGKISLSSNKGLKKKYAELLQVEPYEIINLSLYNFIEDWMGVHYRYGGTDKDGIDCSAFVQRTYADVYGVELVRTALEQYNVSAVIKETHQLHEGDLVFFKIHSRRITHVGIYLANNYFVHASLTQGVMISSLNETYWKKYYAGGGVLIAKNG